MDIIAPFLEDIAANPHDDAPRLILADWIEENGDETLRQLGEFIRVQYALEGLHPGNPRRPGLLRLQEALLPAQLERWKDAVGKLDALTPERPYWMPRQRPRFRRGFIEEARVTYASIRTLSEGGGFGLPIRSLLVAGSSTGDPAGPGLPILEQIEELGLAFDPLADQVRHDWMSSPRLKRVRKLALHPAYIDAFLSCPLRHRIRELELGGGPPVQARWKESARLAAKGSMATLETITLDPALLASQAPNSFLAALQVQALARVVLRGEATSMLAHLPSNIGDRTREAELSWGGSSLDLLRQLPGLETLRLTGWPPAEILPLADISLPLLWSLDITNHRLGEAGVSALTRSPLLPGLRSLRASYCGITRPGAAYLCDALPDGLATLDLSWNAVGAVPFTHIPAGVEALDVSYCAVEDDDVRHLSSWPAGKLNSLNLGTNRLTDAGAETLLSSPALANIEALDLTNNRLTARTADALLESPILRNLRLLLLFGNGLPPDAMRRLRAGFRGIVA
jgi:uncharacterized protein (TIGR02996 family)